MFVASRWYAPWFPQGLPNKQETVGFVCRLSAPVVGHPAPGHVCAANMRMRRGRYASSRERCLCTYACMSMRWQNTRRAHVPTMSSIWCSSSPAWVVPGPGPGPGARARAQGREQMGASQCALMSILFDSPVLVMR